MRNKEIKSKRGITLIALVVTIVVLLILAGITINLVFADGGILQKASDAADRQKEAEESDKAAIEDFAEQANTLINGGATGGGGNSGGGSNPPAATKTIQEIMSELPSTKNENVVDSYGNKITIPAGFIVVANGTSNVSYTYTGDGTPAVQDGIVIQNATDGNQFVWVPVGTINNKSGDSRGATTTIKLGRYSDFTVTNGVLPTPVQEATTSSYNTPAAVNTRYFEVSDTFAGGEFDGTTYKAASEYRNTKAYNLQEWIRTTLKNRGYYIARYEASQSESDNTKAVSLPSKAVWASITQPNAAIAAKATYSAVDGANKDKYYSDLVNSYAWDTAIVFIEAYADSNYAGDNNSTSFTTTGGNNDQVCNINDMSGNAIEWTTETSTNSISSDDYPCTGCGGFYYTDGGRADSYTSSRYNNMTGNSNSITSFRTTLCVK